MSIKEFREKGNSISAKWDFTSFRSVSVDKDTKIGDLTSVGDIVERSEQLKNYSETQEFNFGSEIFTLYDSEGRVIVDDLDKDQADEFIANL